MRLAPCVSHPVSRTSSCTGHDGRNAGGNFFALESIGPVRQNQGIAVTRHIARWPIASLNDLLPTHVWRQDHNGFSHQNPGFIDHVASKKADVVRIYLTPDADALLSVADHGLRSRNYVNLIIAGKQPAPRSCSARVSRRLSIWTR